MEWKCAGRLGVGLEILEIHLVFFFYIFCIFFFTEQIIGGYASKRSYCWRENGTEAEFM